MQPATVRPRTDAAMIGQEIGSAATPAPIATIDSPEGDDHDQPVPFGEVRGGVQPPARRARQDRADVVDDEHGHPHPGLRRALDLRGHQQQRRAPDHRRGEPDQLAPQAVVVARGEPEDREMEHPHREVRERQHHRSVQAARDVVERLGHRRGPARTSRPWRRTSRRGRRPRPPAPRCRATRSPPSTTRAAQSTSSPRSTPWIVRSCAISAVTWVIPKTNTRSKNSSIGVTRDSSETARIRGCFVVVIGSMFQTATQRIGSPYPRSVMPASDNAPRPASGDGPRMSARARSCRRT